MKLAMRTRELDAFIKENHISDEELDLRNQQQLKLAMAGFGMISQAEQLAPFFNNNMQLALTFCARSDMHAAATALAVVRAAELAQSHNDERPLTPKERQARKDNIEQIEGLVCEDMQMFGQIGEFEAKLQLERFYSNVDRFVGGFIGSVIGKQ